MIKVRAWDTVEKRMIQDFLHFCICGSGLGRRDKCLLLCERYVPMLWTGLLDKNGKEIYERDILNPNLRLVSWLAKGFRGMGVGWYTVCHNPMYPKIPFSLSITQAEVSEVIGNIYENPELLNAG